mmetsp:Transcript_12132/g.33619  ORF Transcript_12132/g.33619 Transcript_12132/m.33619 type:complete len:210 (-) Transcript_12132:261-890(-)|eukprot:CAMPEP_0168778146 /NCGR_PEP_ID=MMETSP0725-20121227/6938_1 /TAXON_ID=265536 /ORGANISM="Amphiprora sp., Strain CCMP467" /LENGTH=209 /DNA_ID=CAMNT_0008827919 /DNA_START=109 /DNA_END=738 /DNA_ORIENTATION=+
MAWQQVIAWIGWVIFTLVWLYCIQHLLLAEPRTLAGPHAWGAAASGLAYLFCLATGLDITGDTGSNNATGWWIWIFLGTVPMTLAGLVVENLVLIFCAVGSYAAACMRASFEWAGQVEAKYNSAVFFGSFSVLIMLGLLVGKLVQTTFKASLDHHMTVASLEVDLWCKKRYLQVFGDDDTEEDGTKELDGAGDYEAATEEGDIKAAPTD